MSKKKKKKKKSNTFFGSLSPPKQTCSHKGEPVKVGGYTVYVGGSRYLRGADTAFADILIPLDKTVEGERGTISSVLHYPLQDMGGVPSDWESFLKNTLLPLLDQKKKVLFYCMGGHGRTGTLLASLIAILEPELDPIKTARERHCEKAVESEEQAEAIYALKNETVPDWFQPKVFATTYSYPVVKKWTPRPVITCSECFQSKKESFFRRNICLDCSSKYQQLYNSPPVHFKCSVCFQPSKMDYIRPMMCVGCSWDTDKELHEKDPDKFLVDG